MSATSTTAIALNRFGLGARPDQPAPERPKAWLLDQFDCFEPRPAAIAVLPATSTIAGNLSDYLQMQRQNRRQSDGGMPGQPTRRRAAGYAPLSMDGEAAPGGAAMQGMPGFGQAGAGDQAERRDPVAQARRFAREQARSYYMGAVAARAQTALASPAPFAERLVHFWANHFAVSIDKLTIIGLAGQLEFEAIRPHVMGRFGDMLQAVERHPAMLLYLDQVTSIGPNSAGGQIAAGRQRRQKPGLNENLAREILELHTLGVRTGYGQGDVTELARALTGWTVAGLGRGAGVRFAGIDGEPGSFVFAERLHEPGTRTIMDRSFAQQGENQASAVLDHLATHPATARHIATKLARHFAGDDPPAPLVARLEAAFLKTGGDLRSLYRLLIEAPECWTPQPVKFKTPWEWSMSAMRALGTREMQSQAVTGLLTQLGQPVWRPGSPAGWDDVAASWIGPDAIMRRVEAAERMAGRTGDMIDARRRAVQIFPAALSDATAQAIAHAESPKQGLALLLVSPESMWR
ncbi:DUF1800 domain-containing protein [Sphingobium sp. AS12]|uniref:DUF1800 domain-containing protein n=1 Tax=Sphingobium sp. AS12 TaxID=2849495 RepID=UPI001C31D10C|nr:DUF1800 domain-containing protein [Sphingobium sp. AS12]MBV2149871.1 DUF1800 domain-containing protein [Sphingobium sp. AS12]